ncbi:MAG: glycine cleavage system protein GcvH [Myxococcota bacterium]
MEIPEELRYTETHEWARLEGDVIVVGITAHAQQALGDVTFVELPDVGRTLEVSEDFGVVESVKAVSDVYAPLAGEVVGVNEALEDEDATAAVNDDPYGSGWLVRIRLEEPASFGTLMDAGAYDAFLHKDG